MKIKLLILIAYFMLLVITSFGQSHAYDEQQILLGVLLERIGKLEQRVTTLEGRSATVVQSNKLMNEYHNAYLRLLATYFPFFEWPGSQYSSICESNYKEVFSYLEENAEALRVALKELGDATQQTLDIPFAADKETLDIYWDLISNECK